MKKTPNKEMQQFEKERLSQLERIANHIEKMRLGEYVEMMNRPGRLIWTNLLIGISRGVGLTVGATLVIAVLFKILSALIAMNIPYLTDLLQDVVQIIKEVQYFACVERVNGSFGFSGQIRINNQGE